MKHYSLKDRFVLKSYSARHPNIDEWGDIELFVLIYIQNQQKKYSISLGKLFIHKNGGRESERERELVRVSKREREKERGRERERER